jgi:hypothetical protein
MLQRKSLSYTCEEQRIRLANLLAILRELDDFGVVGLGEKAKVLDADVEVLRSVLLGAAMTDALARTVEHAAGRPHYWIDVEHGEHSRSSTP